MADLYTGVTIQGLFDNSTGSPLFAATGTAVPTSSILVGGSDGVNIQPLSVDSSGRLNVNASSAPPTDSKANATINGDGTGTQFVQVSTEGTSQVQVQVVTAGGFDGTLTFQSSLDGTTFHSFVLYPVLPDGTPGVSTTSASGQWQAPVGGMRLFKVVNTPGTTGTATVFLTAGQGQYSVIAISPNAANFNATVVVSGTPAVNITQVGGSAITLGQKAMAASLPVVIASDQTAYPVNIQASGTALTATGSSLNTNVTNTVTVTGTVAVTQSTSPWVVAGNLTHNNAAPAANNVGVLPAVASTAAPTYTAGDQVLLSTDLAGNLRVSTGTVTVTGTVAVTQSTSPWLTKDAADGTTGAAVPATAIQVAGSDGTNLQAIRVSTNRTTVVIPADEALASSINYFSADQGDTQTSVANPAVKPLLSVRANSAAFLFLLRGIEIVGGGQLTRFQLIKNPATLPGSTFAGSNGHMQIDTAATSFTGGTVVDSGYFAAAHFIKSLTYNVLAGTPGDVYTLVASAISGTIKASGSIQWSETAAAL